MVIDAVGTAATRAQSVDHQRPGGVAVWLGLAEPPAGFDAQDADPRREADARLVRLQRRGIRRGRGLVPAWDLSWTSPYPLSEGAEIFTRLMNGGRIR